MDSSFKDIIEESLKELEESKITVDSFVLSVENMGGLDQALEELDDDELQFYSDNQKQIDRLLQKRGLMEVIEVMEAIASPENRGYLGWARPLELKTKNIKYKGDIISLEFDPDLGTWQPTMRFRSVTKALKYGKMLAELGKGIK